MCVCTFWVKGRILFFFFLFLNLFIFGCIGSSLLCTGFLSLWRVGATLPCGAQASHCGAQASHCDGLSLLWSMDSRRAGLSSCSTQAQ